MNKTIVFIMISLLVALPVLAMTAETPQPNIVASYGEEVMILDAFIRDDLGNVFDVSQDPDSGYETSFRFKPFDVLKNGNYTFVVDASDKVDNSEIYTQDFTIEVPFFIKVIEPRFGVSNRSGYDVVAETSEEAFCSWSLISQGDVLSGNFFDNETQGAYVKSHNLRNVNFNGKTVYFKCRNKAGEDINQGFVFIVDTSAPVITLSANPNPVIDRARRTSDLNITTNDLSVCWINGSIVGDADSDKESSYKASQLEIFTFDVLGKERNQFSYNITCQNKAGLLSQSSYDIIVEFTTAFEIEIVKPESQFVNSDDVDIVVRTPITTFCENVGGIGLSTSDSLTHTLSLTNLGGGDHSYDIQCTSSDHSETVTVGFTFDDTNPSNVSINGDEKKCSLEELGAEFDADDESGIAYFSYSIKDGSGLLINWTNTSSSKVAHKKLELIAGENYIWQMYAYDNAGNSEQADPLTVIPKDSSFEECDFFKPFIELRSVDASGGKTFTVTCNTDSSIGCEGEYNYSIVASGENCVNPQGTKRISENLFVPFGSKVCVWVAGKNGLTSFRQEVISAQQDSGTRGGSGDNTDIGSDIGDDFIPQAPGDDVIRGFCGDGVIDSGEECDGSNLGVFSTCEDLGREGGSLSCTSSCRYDTGDCNTDFTDELDTEGGRFGVLSMLGLILMLGGIGYLVYKKYSGGPKDAGPMIRKPVVSASRAVPGKVIPPMIRSVRKKPQQPSLDKIRELERRKLQDEQERKRKKAERDKIFDEFEVKKNDKKE